jgi:hypothetical protein
LARRPNYGFQKRQKEIKRQRKQAEKAERKRLKKEAADGDMLETTAAVDDLSAPVQDTPTEAREAGD